jgi:RNA polymerase sigma-70 factor (ECF subfamily)
MDEQNSTRMTLLVRLNDPQDQKAWADFVDLYSPVVYGFARKQGLQDADAADLVQDVLRSVERSIRTYDRQKGLFRCWLMSIVRRRLSNFLASQVRRVTAGSGDTTVARQLEQVASASNDENDWELEYQQSLFRLATSRVKGDFAPSTWQAFWQTSVEGKSTREVAQSLGMSEGAVYIAKSRVVARLKQQIEAFEQ